MAKNLIELGTHFNSIDYLVDFKVEANFLNYLYKNIKNFEHFMLIKETTKTM